MTDRTAHLPPSPSRAGLPAAARLALLAALLVPGSCSEPPATDVREPYNARSVVVFLVDTLRAQNLGCYGYGRDTSPRIDRFASEGILFERCVAQSTWTKPATASVLTGLYLAEHGMQALDSVLPDDVPTLAGMLEQAGLETGAFVCNARNSISRVTVCTGDDYNCPKPC